MASLDPLKELLINEIVQIDFPKKSGRSIAKIKECDTGAKLKEVEVYDILSGSVLIRLDKCRQPDSIFKETLGQRKRCDYVLVSHHNNIDFILFIELKSNRLGRLKIVQQFKGAECLIDYCDAALNRFHNQQDLLKGHKKRFIVFYKKLVNKRPTKYPPPPPRKSDSPEKALEYANPQAPSLSQLVTLCKIT